MPGSKQNIDRNLELQADYSMISLSAVKVSSGSGRSV
jgi:hypothetical protein